MRKITALLASVAFAGSLAACSLSSNTAVLNTQELAADAGAIDFAAQAIEAIPSLSQHLTADQIAQLNASLARIKAITGQINAASGGSISIDVGQGWAKDLASEFQTILSIAGPIVGTINPAIAGYIATAQQIIPLIEAAVGLVEDGAMTAVAPQAAPVVRARIFQGV